MQYKAAIFDLDGVLADTAALHYLAWKDLADRLGIPFEKGDNERLKGVSRQKSLEILLSLGNLNKSPIEKEKLAEYKNQKYVELLGRMDERDLLPGAQKCLEYLSAHKIKIALGSASKNAGLIVEHTGLEKWFDAIIDGNQVKNVKPDPEVFLLGADRVGIACKDCVVFEDSVAGIEAARQAGMHTVGIGKRDILNKAEIVVADLKEYMMLLRGADTPGEV